MQTELLHRVELTLTQLLMQPTMCVNVVTVHVHRLYQHDRYADGMYAAALMQQPLNQLNRALIHHLLRPSYAV